MQTLAIELTVRNHPGVMCHVAGLFARRAFNLEGVFCHKIGDGAKSRMLLLVNKEDRLEQIIKELRNLYDVLEVSLREEVAFPVSGRGAKGEEG